MHPLYTEPLASLRQDELTRKAAQWRLGRLPASTWDHPWRRGLGKQLEHWGRRLQGAAPERRPVSPPTAG